MQKKIIKKQISIFGMFAFAPKPELMANLAQIFVLDGLMPTLIQSIDFGTGKQDNKICLTNGTNFQIIFSSDRIDFLDNAISDEEALDAYIRTVKHLIEKLPDITRGFSRYALVCEYLLYDISQNILDKIKGKSLPGKFEKSFEWNTKWIKYESVNPAQKDYVISLDISTFEGAVSQTFTLKNVAGLKIIRDISTNNLNTELIYKMDNFDETFSKFLNLHDDLASYVVES